MKFSDKLLTEFWLNFIKKDFNLEDYFIAFLSRESIDINILSIEKIDFHNIYGNIYWSVEDKHLPRIDSFYQKEINFIRTIKEDFIDMEYDIFKSGKYDKKLELLSVFIKKKLEWSTKDVSLNVYLQIMEYTNFGASYTLGFKTEKLRYGTGFTEIDFLKNEIKSAEATIRNLENGTSLNKYDLIDLFNIRIFRFNKRISEITNEKPIRLECIVNTFDYSDISDNIFKENIDILKAIEDRLINDGYFNSDLKYNTTKGYKVKLVALIHILHKLKVIKQKVVIISHRKFFEKRYKVDISKQMQKKQFDITKIKKYKTDFIFISDFVDNYTSIF